MNNFSKSDDIKIHDGHKIKNETIISNDFKNPSDELNLFNLRSDNKIMADILTKIKTFIDEAEQENIEKDILIHEWQIFNDFFNLIDKHEKNLTDEDLSAIRKALGLFIQATRNFHIDNFFKTDLIYAKEIFYMYFNLFNIGFIQSYLNNSAMYDNLGVPYNSCIALIFFVMRRAIRLVTDLSMDDIQRPINCIELQSFMLNYVKTDLESSELISNASFTDALNASYQCLYGLLSYSDKTVLVSDLIEIGCPETMVNGLTMICKTPDAQYDVQLGIFSIIFNISRHDEGVKQLNTLNAAEVIKLFQSENENTLLNTMCCMILALLSTPEQIKNDYKRMRDVLDTLLKMVYEAVVSSNHKSGDWFHLSELLVVFVKLFTDDRTLNYVMEHSQVDLHTSSTVEFFINLLITYHSTISNEHSLKQATCTALVNILWSISFQEKYKQELKNTDERFLELIQSLATGETVEKLLPNQYVPQYIENVQKAAKGILFNIDESIDLETKQVNSVSTVSNNNEKPMIMISYSHEDIDFCKQLHDEMHKRGYDIWIDFKFLKTGDLWEQIAAGMKRANIIVCLMSEDYCKSKSCRWEAIYALDKLQTKKTIIPVLLRKHELPDWLDIRIAMLKYVRFLDLNQLENDKLFELMTAIEHSLPANVPRTDHSLHSSILPTHHEPKPIPVTKTNEFPSHNSNILPKHHDESAPIKQDISLKAGHTLNTTTDQSPHPEKPVEQWNQNDISQWFQHNEILTEFRDLCRFKDGYELY